MKKWTVMLSFVLVFALLLVACTAPVEDEDGMGTPSGTDIFSPGEGVDEPLTTRQLATPTLMSPETLEPEETEPEEAGTPEPAGTQPVGGGAQIIPATGGQSLNQLSTLIGYQVIDRDGALIGTASDYIINLCQAHVLYIIVNLDAILQGETSQALIPYELVTLQNGTISGADQTVQVNIVTGDLVDIPAYAPDSMLLTDAAWETDVITFWSGHMTQSLTTECLVEPFQPGESGGIASTPVITDIPGTPAATPTPTLTGTVTIPVQPTQTPSINSESQDDLVGVTRLILASTLMGAEMEDGNGEMLGMVADAIVVPQTGLVRYLAVSLDQAEQAQTDGPLVLVPVRAVNVQYEGQDDSTPLIVLLVERDILLNAPTIDALAELEEGGFSADAFNYWSDFVPLEEEGLPQP